MAVVLIGAALATKGPVESSHTTQQNPLGMRSQDSLGNIYIYLPGVASLKAFDTVKYNPSTFATTRIVAGSVGPVAVAQAAIAATEWGWFMISGVTYINNKGAVTINTQLYIANSSASLDSTYVAGDQVHTAVAVTSSTALDGSGIVLASIQYPWANAHSDS